MLIESAPASAAATVAIAIVLVLLPFVLTFLVIVVNRLPNMYHGRVREYLARLLLALDHECV